jgi:hypothetical protein
MATLRPHATPPSQHRTNALAASWPVLLLAVLSTGCHGGHGSGTELLERFQKCHAAIPQQLSSGSFYSPCVRIDPSPLNGIARARLTAALGPPHLCVGLGRSGPPQGRDCPPDANATWEFYRLSQASLGAGVELVCEIEPDQRCARVYWTQTE